MTDRSLDLDDIQGNILGGFNTDFQEHVALSGSPATLGEAANWLASIADEVTVVAEVRATRDRMKAALPSQTWLFVAVGQRLLRSAAPDVLIRDEAFNGGLLKRAPSILGDRTDPATWKAGGGDTPVDVFMIVAANDKAAVATRTDGLLAAAERSGLSLSWRETTMRLRDREHFGFRDGVSQPLVWGDDEGGTAGAGQFIFGYPETVGGTPFSPTVDPRGLTDNGSLAVWRRLRQDVAAFREFCIDASKAVSDRWPDLTATHLAALLVGRWPSGTPLGEGVDADPNASSPSNGFDFKTGSEAKACPFGAHIRKVNPRAGPKDVVDVPRMIRRGIQFGPRYDDAPDVVDRGLAFLAFQSSIKNQFEFLTQHWMNSASLPADGDDLLVGSRDGPRSITVMGPNGAVTIPGPTRSWIMPTGGAYLFVPGRRGLKKLGEPPAPLGPWKARQLVAMATDGIRGLF